MEGLRNIVGFFKYIGGPIVVPFLIGMFCLSILVNKNLQKQLLSGAKNWAVQNDMSIIEADQISYFIGRSFGRIEFRACDRAGIAYACIFRQSYFLMKKGWLESKIILTTALN